jgi:hypothetical protein
LNPVARMLQRWRVGAGILKASNPFLPGKTLK